MIRITSKAECDLTAYACKRPPAKIEPGVKVLGVFPDDSDDPIVYPVAATVSAKPETIRYLALLRSTAAESIFESYSFSVLANPTS